MMTVNESRRLPFPTTTAFRLANHSTHANANAFYDRSALLFVLCGLGRRMGVGTATDTYCVNLLLYLWGRPWRPTTRYQGYGAMRPLKIFEGLIGGRGKRKD